MKRPKNAEVDKKESTSVIPPVSGLVYDFLESEPAKSKATPAKTKKAKPTLTAPAKPAEETESPKKAARPKTTRKVVTQEKNMTPPSETSVEALCIGNISPHISQEPQSSPDIKSPLDQIPPLNSNPDTSSGQISDMVTPDQAQEPSPPVRSSSAKGAQSPDVSLPTKAKTPPEIVLKDNKITAWHLAEVFKSLTLSGSEPVTLLSLDKMMKKCVKEIREQGYAKLGFRNLKHLLLSFAPYFKCSTRVSPEGVERDIVEMGALEIPPPEPESPAPEPVVEALKPAAAKKKTTKAKTLVEEAEPVEPETPAVAIEAVAKPEPTPKGAKTVKGTKVSPKAKAVKGAKAAPLPTPETPISEAKSPAAPTSGPAKEAKEPLAPKAKAPAKTKAKGNPRDLFSVLTPPEPTPEPILDPAATAAPETAPETAPTPEPPKLELVEPEPVAPSPEPTKTKPAAVKPAETQATPPEAEVEVEPTEPPEVSLTPPLEAQPETPEPVATEPATREPYSEPSSPSPYPRFPSTVERGRPDPRDLRGDLRYQGARPARGLEVAAPMNTLTSGTVTEINVERRLITAREDLTGNFFSGYIPPFNVSWSLVKTLLERGEKDIRVEFVLKPNTDTLQFAQGMPVITDLKYSALDEKTNRGLSVWFHDIIYMPKISSGPGAAHPTFEQMLEKLAQFAQPEKWYYSDSRKPYNLLENYFLKTFQNLQKEKINRFLDIFATQGRLPDLLEVNDAGLAFSADYQLAALNIGLMDQASRDILVVFKKTDSTQKRFVFKGFTATSDNPLGKEVSTKIHPRPARTTYYQKPDEMIYKNIPIDLDHDAQCNHIIVDGIRRGRFPHKFISAICPTYFRYVEDNSRFRAEEVEATNSDLAKFIEEEDTQSTYVTLKEKLKTALDLTQRQIVANPRIPLPYWNPARDKLAFILPLALADPRDYDVVLVVEQITDTDGGVVKPFVHTILTLSMASKGARLISSLQDTWLGTLKDKNHGPNGPATLNGNRPDFPLQFRPTPTPPPRSLKSPSTAVPNLSPRFSPRVVAPPIAARPAPRVYPVPTAPATPAPVAKKSVSFHEIRVNFSEETRYYAQPSVNELNPAFLMKVFEFCAARHERGPNGEKMVPIQFFHEVLVQIIPRLALDNEGYSGFNPNYSDLTAVLELYQDRFALRKNRADRIKYIYLLGDSREAQPSLPPPVAVTVSNNAIQSNLKQGTVVGPIQDKNSVTIVGEDGTERRARVKDTYDLTLINKLLALDYPGVDVTYYCAQTYSRADLYDSSKKGLFYEITDVRSAEIDPDLRAILNTSFPTEFYPDMLSRLRDDTSFNPLYHGLMSNLRVYLSHCLELRKHLALHKLTQLVAKNSEGRQPEFHTSFADIFLLHGFAEVLSQKSFSFNINLQTASSQAIFANFQRSATSDAYYRFSSLVNHAVSGPEAYATSQFLQKWIQEILPSSNDRLNISLTDESAWSRLMWFGSEHGIIPPYLSSNPEDCLFNMKRAFHHAAEDLAQAPQNSLVAWDSVSKALTLLLPLQLSLSGQPDMVVGFRFVTHQASRLLTIDPGSIRLFSLAEAFLRAQVVRPVEDCWLTKALLAQRAN
ncbi:MAG: DUF3825 domain-containing protein [Deltaproteobacteria bacterium]|nr:DUF3825 domain-containing protein [Deltaproteobacteria bacterium]